MAEDTPAIPYLEREITRLKNATQEYMLRGDAKDYAAYASLVARYRVLHELTDFIDERKAKGDSIDED